MRGNDEQQGAVFSYVSAEQRIAREHPLRRIRSMTDEALRGLSGGRARRNSAGAGRKGKLENQPTSAPATRSPYARAPTTDYR